MKKVFYHLGLEKDGLVNMFYPRVPESIIEDEEDDEIERICLSDSIENCLSAVPWGGEGIDLQMNNKNISVPIIVYEFSNEILEENLIEPNELKERGLVPDAIENQEYWVVNQNLTPEKVYYIRLKNENFKENLDYEIIDIDDYIVEYSFSFEKNLAGLDKENAKKKIFDYMKENMCSNAIYENIEFLFNNNEIEVVSHYDICYLNKKEVQELINSL